MIPVGYEELRKAVDHLQPILKQNASVPPHIRLEFKKHACEISTVGDYMARTTQICVDSDTEEEVVLKPFTVPKVTGCCFCEIHIKSNVVIFDYGSVCARVERVEDFFLRKEKLLKHDEPVFSIGVNPKLLRALCDTFKESKAVRFDFFGAKSIVQITDVESNEEIGIIMPCRIGK